ncbi:hypothetical protein LINPERPRIM_LOCUS6449, partial [Linum perenne]
ITFQRVPPAVISQEGISWLSSLIGKPVRNFVRDGLDIKVCIIRDKAIPCPESLKILDEDEQHVIQVIQAKARDYTRKGFERQVYRPKAVVVGVSAQVDKEAIPIAAVDGIQTPTGIVIQDANHSSPENEKQDESSPKG